MTLTFKSVSIFMLQWHHCYIVERIIISPLQLGFHVMILNYLCNWHKTGRKRDHVFAHLYKFPDRIIWKSNYSLLWGIDIAYFFLYWVECQQQRSKPVVQPTSVLTKASVWYEIGVLWANITHIKSHAVVLGFCFQTDINQIF